MQRNSTTPAATSLDQAIAVRRCRMGDAARLGEMLKVCWHATYDPILGRTQVARLSRRVYSRFNLAIHIAQSLLSRKSTLLVATHEHAPVGHAMAQRDGHEIVLYSLYVHPDWQGRGIGSSLLDTVIAGFPGAKAIRLEVLKDNARAIAWYQAKAFDIYGGTENATGTAGIASVYMDKALSGAPGELAGRTT